MDHEDARGWSDEALPLTSEVKARERGSFDRWGTSGMTNVSCSGLSLPCSRCFVSGAG